MSARECSVHVGVGTTQRCQSCGRWLCVECLCFRVDGLRWCADCVEHLKTVDDGFPLAFGITVAVVGSAVSVFLLIRDVFGGWLTGFGVVATFRRRASDAQT